MTIFQLFVSKSLGLVLIMTIDPKNGEMHPQKSLKPFPKQTHQGVSREYQYPMRTYNFHRNCGFSASTSILLASY